MCTHRIIPLPRALAGIVLAAMWLAACSPASRAAPADKTDEASDSDSAAADNTDAEKKPSRPASAKEEKAVHNPFTRRAKAPDLSGGTGWLNTAGPLELEKLRGKFVLLDFWTYCCINCMHILPELKKLEAEFPKELVVIGVHSAKFETERDSKNITDAIMRYEIQHPVINDSKHEIWNRYGVNTWPTVLLIDPEGYVVYGRTGEFEAETFISVLKSAIPWYRKKGVLDETPLRFDLAADQVQDTPLRYPGKILADEAGGRLFIADSNHNRLVIARLDGSLVDTIGSGALGAADGDFRSATFNHPQGMALDGETLYVADTENHLLRKVDLAEKQVTTIAGTGEQARGWGGLDENRLHHGRLPLHFGGKPKVTALNSPWDLLIDDRVLYIAMAGPHQIWKMPLSGLEIGPYAGNGREDIVDGPLLPRRPYDEGFSSFAQPSGLASDGKQLYVADSEGSSIRVVPLAVAPGALVKTLLGTAHLDFNRLFDFGDVDGEGFSVRLQHPLGLAFYEGKLYIADTYNNKVKVVDVITTKCQTLAGTGQAGKDDAPAMFHEPAGLSAAAGRLYVADTNNHAIRTIALNDGNRVATLEISGLQPPKPIAAPDTAQLPGAKEIQVPAAKVKPTDGNITIEVAIHLADGYKMNALAPTRYVVKASDAEGPIDRTALGKSVRLDPPSTKFNVTLPVRAGGKQDQLSITLNYYYCQEGAEGLCKAGSVVWQVPIEISADAASSTVNLETWGQ
jgi:thiol-disulfide isomerase/thioredoxin